MTSAWVLLFETWYVDLSRTGFSDFVHCASSGGRCALVNTPLVAWMACNETVVLMCVFSGGHTGVEHHVPVEQWHPLHRFPCGVLGWPECVQHVTVQLVLPPHGGEQQPCRHIPEADSAVDG